MCVYVCVYRDLITFADNVHRAAIKCAKRYISTYTVFVRFHAHTACIYVIVSSVISAIERAIDEKI